MAGIWESWKDQGGKEILSAAIITTGPNDLMASIHDRMPVILPRKTWDQWLGAGENEVGSLERLLQPYPANEMEAWPISTMVNSPLLDHEEILAPA
jgi:putative SOS response-associated peptidase YedK